MKKTQLKRISPDRHPRTLTPEQLASTTGGNIALGVIDKLLSLLSV